RDLKWPQRHPILTQYDFAESRKFERYMDSRHPYECGFGGIAQWEGDHLWHARQHHTYSRLEICGVTPEHIGDQPYVSWHQRKRFGLFINEARSYEIGRASCRGREEIEGDGGVEREKR